MTNPIAPVEQLASVLVRDLTYSTGLTEDLNNNIARVQAEAVIEWLGEESTRLLARDAIARAIAPEDWTLAEHPRYKNLPDQAREQLISRSRDMADRVLAALKEGAK